MDKALCSTFVEARLFVLSQFSYLSYLSATHPYQLCPVSTTNGFLETLGELNKIIQDSMQEAPRLPRSTTACGYRCE